MVQAPIGLRDLYVAELLSDPFNGQATYGAPRKLSPAMSAEVAPQIASNDLPGDDIIQVHVDQLTSVQITIGLTDLMTADAAFLLGQELDENGLRPTKGTDLAPYLALGFRARTSDGGYKYYWFYKGTFAQPTESFQTKGTEVNFATPSIVGTFTPRNSDEKLFDAVHSNDPGVNQDVIAGWFDSVYGGGGAVAATGITLSAAEQSVEAGATATLSATVEPDDASNKDVVWKSSNTDVATVDGAGKVTGVAEGTAVITAQLESDLTKIAACVVTVTAAA